MKRNLTGQQHFLNPDVLVLYTIMLALIVKNAFQMKKVNKIHKTNLDQLAITLTVT